MSGGPVCRCPERKRRIELRNWKITAYRCNASAFNGYKVTPSDWSEVQCGACGRRWRTQARYLMSLSFARDGLTR